jgi:hypothetical protein
MPSPTPRRPDDLVQLLTRAERLAALRLQAVLEDEGCSLDAWRVLALLADGEGLHMTAIAQAAFLPPPTLTKLVDPPRPGVLAAARPRGARRLARPRRGRR